MIFLLRLPFSSLLLKLIFYSTHTANNEAEDRKGKQIFAEPETYPTEEYSWRQTIAPPAYINIEDLEKNTRQDESHKLTEEEIKQFIKPESRNESLENIQLAEPITAKGDLLEPLSDKDSRKLFLKNPTPEPKFNINNQTHHKPIIIKKPNHADQYFGYPQNDANNEFTNKLLINPTSFKNRFIALEGSEYLQPTINPNMTEEPTSTEKATSLPPVVVKLASKNPSKSEVNQTAVSPAPSQYDSASLEQKYHFEPERSSSTIEIDSTVKTSQYSFAEEEQSMGVISEGKTPVQDNS